MVDDNNDDSEKPLIPPLRPVEKKSLGKDSGSKSGAGKAHKPKGYWQNTRNTGVFPKRSPLPPEGK